MKKYQGIARSLHLHYKDVSLEVIVVGALGSWDPSNDRIYHWLCSKKYTKLMKKLIVADTVRHSRNIYVKHINRPDQSQPPRYTRFFHDIADPVSSSPDDPSVVAFDSVPPIPNAANAQIFDNGILPAAYSQINFE